MINLYDMLRSKPIVVLSRCSGSSSSRKMNLFQDLFIHLLLNSDQLSQTCWKKRKLSIGSCHFCCESREKINSGLIWAFHIFEPTYGISFSSCCVLGSWWSSQFSNFLHRTAAFILRLNYRDGIYLMSGFWRQLAVLDLSTNLSECELNMYEGRLLWWILATTKNNRHQPHLLMMLLSVFAFFSLSQSNAWKIVCAFA